VTGDDGVVLVPKTRLQPDTRHHFVTEVETPVTHVRLDVFPDGGVARLRVHGEIERAALAAMRTSEAPAAGG
jgi:allantoicase